MIARIQKSIKENEEGFTLIELLVVIIIIGILAAIAIPVFLNQRKKAVDASTKSDLRTVANEMETFYVDNQAYPASVGNSTGLTTGNTITVTTGSPISLSSGNAISVVYNTGATAYCITGSNTKGSTTGGAVYTYISSKGGLQPGTAAVCPAAGAF